MDKNLINKIVKNVLIIFAISLIIELEILFYNIVINKLYTKCNLIGNDSIEISKQDLNIETVNGSASQQNSGVINTYNTINDISSMLDLIDKLLASLPEIQGVDAEEIENVKDDLEMVQEQLKTDNPKKNRIGKALVGIKKFASDFSKELVVTLAAGAVTGADWGMLLQQLENFIR